MGTRTNPAAAFLIDRKTGKQGAFAPEVRDVEVTVFAVIPEYHQAKVETKDGRQYAITRHTKGVQPETLREGQHLMCTVTLTLPRVLSARVVD